MRFPWLLTCLGVLAATSASAKPITTQSTYASPLAAAKAAAAYAANRAPEKFGTVRSRDFTTHKAIGSWKKGATLRYQLITSKLIVEEQPYATVKVTVRKLGSGKWVGQLSPKPNVKLSLPDF